MKSNLLCLMKSRIGVLVLLGVVLGTLGFLVYERVSPGGLFADLKNDLKEIDPKPEAQYTDLDGNLVPLTRFKGKPLIVNSWATWMPFSQTELPLLARVGDEHGDDLNIIAINRKEDRTFIRSYLSTYGIPEDSLVFLTDPTDHFYTTVGGYAMPETVFYYSDGTLLNHTRGTLNEADLRATITTLLSR